VHAESPALPAAKGCAGGRQACTVREALRDVERSGGGIGGAGPCQASAWARCATTCAFYPMNQEAHARIQAGEIGVPRIVHAEYCQDWLFLPTDWNWRLVPEQGGEARAVGDIGTHVLDMLQWLTGGCR